MIDDYNDDIDDSRRHERINETQRENPDSRRNEFSNDGNFIELDEDRMVNFHNYFDDEVNDEYQEDPMEDPDDIDALIDKARGEYKFYTQNGKDLGLNFDSTPKEFKEWLDQYVIRQERAKKVISNAICYHYAKVLTDLESDGNYEKAIKKNVLLIGPTGVGKTYLVEKSAERVGVPFIKCDATKYSSTGYVGLSVEDMVRDLVIAAEGNITLAENGIIYIDEIDKLAGAQTFVKDVSGVEVQRSLLKLLEETEVDLSAGNPLASIQMSSGSHAPKINTKNILFICSGAFPGLEDQVEHRMLDDFNNSKKWYDQLTTKDLSDFGLEREFIGRLPIKVGLDNLDAQDLFEILKNSKDSVVNQYTQDFSFYDIDVTFSDEALMAIAELAVEENTGARALVSVFEGVLEDYLFELPSTNLGEFEFTAEMVHDPDELRKLIARSEGKYLPGDDGFNQSWV